MLTLAVVPFAVVQASSCLRFKRQLGYASYQQSRPFHEQV